MLYFLKLGGSLITDKNHPYTTNKEILSRLVEEISKAVYTDSSLRLVIGHGSGSFGHAAAKINNPDQAKSKSDRIMRYQKIWLAARKLNNIIINELSAVNLPVISFPPSSSIILENRKLVYWNTEPIQAALEHGLIPVIYGDVIFDRKFGNTILSTEDLFNELASRFLPDSILICGKEKGVWEDFPLNENLIQSITPENYKIYSTNITTSESTDVTGGMASKIRILVDIVSRHPTISAQVFSGGEKGNLLGALNGKKIGTRISGSD